MSTPFCCQGIAAYRPTRTEAEAKFSAFVAWAKAKAGDGGDGDGDGDGDSGAEGLGLGLEFQYAVQLVRQRKFGPLESKRYFVPVPTASGGGGGGSGSVSVFKEVSERDLVQANFQKVNSYKNFKCAAHHKFFEVNLYQKDPHNRHHWRADIARPGSEIDL